MGYRSKMRRKRGRRVRRYLLIGAVLVVAGAAAFLMVRAGVSTVVGFFTRNSSSIGRLSSSPELKKTLVVVGAESTQKKNLATGVLLVQVDGVKREINAISVDPNTFVEVPGQGFERIGESLQTGPETVAVTVSNLFGVRAKKYVVIRESDFRRLLSKQEFTGLMSRGIEDNVSKAGTERLNELIGQVAQDGVSVVPLPVEPLSLGNEIYYQPKKDDIDKLVAGWWQVKKRKETRRLRVMVLNGAGLPGIAGEVASTLIGRGYQVIDSKNADSFNYSKTLILLYHANKNDGLTLKKILGVGQVMTKDLPQDIADVSVVVGKDYLTKSKKGKRSGR